MMHLNLYYLKNKNFWCLLTLLYFNLVLGQDLSQYIQEAMENNPQIQAFELQYKISEAKIEEVQTLPNTQFGIGYFVSETETRVGAQRLKVFAKQQLPWFGTITSRKNYKKVLNQLQLLVQMQTFADLGHTQENLQLILHLWMGLKV